LKACSKRNHTTSRKWFEPYSPKLTEDYYDVQLYYYADHIDEIDHTYDLVVETSEGISYGTPPLPDTFDKNRFLEVVSKKGESWLEVAATILDVSRTHNERKKIVELVTRMKPRYGEEFIRRVYNELERYNITDCR
jgi:uncharacterized protein YwgA